MFDHDKSNFGQAVCHIPKISTVYSNEKFTIEPIQEDLKFQKLTGTFENLKMLNDDHLTKMLKVKKDAKECSFGGQFKENHIGLLQQVRWFMGDIEQKVDNKY